MSILFIAAALIAAPPSLAKPASPEQLERETWQAFQAKRVGEIRSMFARDYVGLYADGTKSLESELMGLKRLTIEDYRLSNFTSRTIDANDVLLTYAADLKATLDGKPLLERLWIASLWHRENKRWLTAYHTEIRAK